MKLGGDAGGIKWGVDPRRGHSGWRVPGPRGSASRVPSPPTLSSSLPAEHQHARYNPLQDDWVLVLAHRVKCPW